MDWSLGHSITLYHGLFTNMKKLFSLILLVAIFLLGCHFSKPMSPTGSEKIPAHDTVLSAGQVVTFRNPNGAGKIKYFSDFKRIYEIEGNSYKVELVQRSKEFQHLKGIYNPGETWGPLPLSDSAPSRFVVDESEVHFATTEECERFFKEGAAYEKWVGGTQGLALGFMLSPGRDQVNVSLYRCFVGGKLMKSIPVQFLHTGYVKLQ